MNGASSRKSFSSFGGIFPFLLSGLFIFVFSYDRVVLQKVVNQSWWDPCLKVPQIDETGVQGALGSGPGSAAKGTDHGSGTG